MSISALSGLAGIALAVSGAIIWMLAPIDPPAGAAAIAAHYAEHRTGLIVTSVVVVGGSALVAAWYVVVASLVADRVGRVLALVGVTGMAIQIAALSIAFCVFAGLAYRRAEPELAQTLTEIAWLLISLAGGPVTAVAVVAFAVALTRQGLGGRWLLPLSAATAVAHLIVAASFARNGFLSPTGGIEMVVPLVYQAWIGAVGVALLRAPDSPSPAH